MIHADRNEHLQLLACIRFLSAAYYTVYNNLVTHIINTVAETVSVPSDDCRQERTSDAQFKSMGNSPTGGKQCAHCSRQEDVVKWHVS